MYSALSTLNNYIVHKLKCFFLLIRTVVHSMLLCTVFDKDMSCVHDFSRKVPYFVYFFFRKMNFSEPIKLQNSQVKKSIQNRYINFVYV